MWNAYIVCLMHRDMYVCRREIDARAPPLARPSSNATTAPAPSATASSSATSSGRSRFPPAVQPTRIVAT